MKSASLTAATGSSVMVSLPPDTRQLASAHSRHSAGAWYLTGAACVKLIPNRVQISISEDSTLVASPMKVTFRSSMRLPSGMCSSIVITSHTTWVGWL